MLPPARKSRGTASDSPHYSIVRHAANVARPIARMGNDNLNITFCHLFSVVQNWALWMGMPFKLTHDGYGLATKVINHQVNLSPNNGVISLCTHRGFLGPELHRSLYKRAHHDHFDGSIIHPKSHDYWCTQALVAEPSFPDSLMHEIQGRATFRTVPQTTKCLFLNRCGEGGSRTLAQPYIKLKDIPR